MKDLDIDIHLMYNIKILWKKMELILLVQILKKIFKLMKYLNIQKINFIWQFNFIQNLIQEYLILILYLISF